VPQDPKALQQKWTARITHARAHWSTFHKRVRHNRNTVAGFNWNADPTGKDFYSLRANLIHGTISAVLPNVYARNPEISTAPTHSGADIKLFCKTLEKVTNRALEHAQLKNRAKSTVRAALTCSFGILKVMYQRDPSKDAYIQGRINDAQENLLAIEDLARDLQEDDQRHHHDAKRAELEELIKSLHEQTEVQSAEGLVIDRVLTENLLIDPSICEFWDYTDADWICQIIPMKRGQAEALYKKNLANAKIYQPGQGEPSHKKAKRLASMQMNAGSGPVTDDQQIAVLEIWDRATQRVYTMVEGATEWLREPYSPPRAGERWYPFFLLPYQVVDGQFVGPSLVDLTERLQDEHNEARDRFNQHRDLCIPGWVASADINEKTIKKHSDSRFGEITIVDTEGKPLNQVIIPRGHPKIDPIVYDTSAVRYDWEQVTGLQDAARSTVVRPKTATEANILQRALSGRVFEFKDQIEDWLQEIAQYSAQVLLQELTKEQVERYMGPPSTKTTMVNGELVMTMEKTYDWPELTKDRIFDMVDLRIRAGTTGAPDGIEDKESWLKVLPMITNLSIQMQNLQARGMDYEHIRNLLHETLLRYDDRIDSNLFIPNVERQAEGWSRDDDPNLGMNWFSERKQKSGAEMHYGSNLLKEETGNDASSK
jgi:5'(3')-deoxyribonucleotidase